jgi:ubiquitin carboxyl-terminal hydrolase 4/11/15
MCERLGLNVDDVRVWDFYNMSKYKHLEDLKQRLDSAQIIEGQAILLEEKDANGKFPEIPKAKTGGYSSYSSYYNSGGPTDPGTTGLIYLGNTCFMNSAIQCLSNATPLTNYFTTDQYKTDVNADNPLGMKGELAEEWASLIKELWSGTHSAVAPRDFKWKLERFAPQFAGYQQHDSQELLAFLLDGLHEDLNRIKQKPYTENPEVKDQPEDVVSKLAWETHRKRNDSIIVDWFQGQLKSTLVCPKCDRVSITFDPFMYLSLPLPMKMTRLITVTLFYMDGHKKPTRFGCEVSKAASIKELKKVLSGLSGVSAESLILCDVYNSRFFKSFPDNEGVDGIQDRDFICAYETLVSNSDSDDVMYFPVIHRKEEVMGYHSMHNFSRKTLFGYPFVISIPDANKITYKQLYDLIYLQVQRFLKLPKGRVFRSTDDIPDEWADSSSSGGNKNRTPAQQAQQEYFQEREDSDVSTDSDAEKKSDEDGEQEQELTTRKKIKRSQPLFTIRTVDNYGMTDHEVLVDNDKPLRLDSRETLAVNWTDDIHDLIYDESVEKDFEYDASYRRQQTSNPQEREQEQSVSLQSCIDMFTGVEKLGPEDPWYCAKCQEFQQATKKFDLWKLPPVLVVHLKRFSYKNRYWREKLETFVDYPIHDLDLSSQAKGPQDVPPNYELFAVSNHYGSLGGGHYTAYAKNKNDGKWYKFDDSSVSPVEESRVKTSSGYVLFYQRKDTIQQPSSSTSTTTSTGNNNNAEPMEVTQSTTSHADQSMDDVDP